MAAYGKAAPRQGVVLEHSVVISASDLCAHCPLTNVAQEGEEEALERQGGHQRDGAPNPVGAPEPWQQGDHEGVALLGASPNPISPAFSQEESRLTCLW